MIPFKEYVTENKITKNKDGRFVVSDKDDKVLGTYDSQEAAERHKVNKDRGTRK